MACSQTVGANLCQRQRVYSSTDSIVYVNKQRKDVCTCIYCYQTCAHASFVSLWLTGIPGPQEKEVLKLPLDSNMWDERACALHPQLKSVPAKRSSVYKWLL